MTLKRNLSLIVSLLMYSKKVYIDKLNIVLLFLIIS